METVFSVLAAFFLLTACGSVSDQRSSISISGYVEKSTSQVVSDLNALPKSIGLHKDRYWRQHGSVLASEKQNLKSDSGEKTGYFKDDIQTYWSPIGEDKGKLPIYFGVRASGSNTRMQISSGDAHTRADRVPKETMSRLAIWLKRRYGNERITLCIDKFC